MVDVFISYSRKHRDTINPLVLRLRALNLSVWFDADIEPGTVFGEEIESRLNEAKCVVVVWTKDAVAKGPRGWVHSEADWALSHKKLIQAQIEQVRLSPPFFSSVEPPIELGALGTARAWQLLLEKIGTFTGRPGLSKFERAQRSDALLAQWRKRYPSDPIVTRGHPALCALDDRVSARVELEATPSRNRVSLDAELRALVAETLEAPSLEFERGRFTFEDERGSTSEFQPDWVERTAFFGLEFHELAVERDFDGATPLLLVTGQIRNIGRDPKFLPHMKCALRNPRSAEIFQMILPPPVGSLAEGESTEFCVRIANPPEDSVDLEMTFAEVGKYETAKESSELLLDQPVE